MSRKPLAFLIACLLLVAVSCRSPDERRVLVIGTVEITAERCGWLLPKVDHVELFAFDRATTNNGAATFFVHYLNEGPVPVTNHVVLDGAPAEQFASKWRKLHFWWAYASLCHDPGFGVRFSSEGKLLFETAICLRCSDFSFKTKLGPQLCGFDDKSPATLTFSNALAEAFISKRL